MKLGVLALQGDFAEHQLVLERLGQDTCQVRLPPQLEALDGLIIPGGESTTFSRLMDLYELKPTIAHMAARGVPIWGTCAGMIIMARGITENGPTPMGLLDIQVERNGFGRQVDSFEVDLPVRHLGAEALPAVFIRAPLIVQVGPEVEVLAALPDGRPVAVRQKNLLATSFHPELTTDTRFHRYFLDMVSGTR